MKRIYADISDDTKSRIRVEAAKKGVTIKAYLEDLITQALPEENINKEKIKGEKVNGKKTRKTKNKN